MINALFVIKDGPYSNMGDVDPWDEERNALLCNNGLPAVCHPPCQRWGRYWGGGPSAKVKRHKGDDGGCFAFALWYVRTFGGVIEHPEASHAWPWFGLTKPPMSGGWVQADEYGGHTCCVSQGKYGHKARKATWLYANKVELPELTWGMPKGMERLELGPHSKEHAAQIRSAPGYKPIKRLSVYERTATPTEFRDLLISIASTAN